MFLLRLGQILFGMAACSVTALAVWLMLKRNVHAPMFIIVGGALIVIELLSLSPPRYMLAGAAVLLALAGAGLLVNEVTAARAHRHDSSLDVGDSTATRRRH